MEEEIKIKKEEPSTEEKTDTFFSEDIHATQSAIYRDRLPIGNASVARDAKISQNFTISGLIYYSADPITVSTDIHTTTQTNLATFTFDKNSLHEGEIIRVTANGYFSSTATPQFTLRIGSGNAPTTAWNDMTSPSEESNNMPWELVWTGIITAAGSSGTIEGQLRGTESTYVRNDYKATTSAIDTTSKLILALTCQWSSNTAGNTLTRRQFIVELLG